MTDDEQADYKLLSLANEKRKFAVEVLYPMPPGDRAAFERGMDHEWFTLVDVDGIAHAPGRLMRVFRLTDAGMERLAELGKMVARDVFPEGGVGSH